VTPAPPAEPGGCPPVAGRARGPCLRHAAATEDAALHPSHRTPAAAHPRACRPQPGRRRMRRQRLAPLHPIPHRSSLLRPISAPRQRV